MSLFLGIMGIIFVLVSLGTCTVAKGAPHEIEGLILLLIGVLLVAVMAVIDVLERPARQRDKAIRSGHLMRCGACRGDIDKDATRCKHCGVPVAQSGKPVA